MCAHVCTHVCVHMCVYVHACSVYVCAHAHTRACARSLCTYESEGVSEYERVYLNRLYDIMTLLSNCLDKWYVLHIFGIL